jgi:hypothetical protein
VGGGQEAAAARWWRDLLRRQPAAPGGDTTVRRSRLVERQPSVALHALLHGLADLASTAVRAGTTHAGELVIRKLRVTRRPEAAVIMAVAEPMLTPQLAS